MFSNLGMLCINSRSTEISIVLAESSLNCVALGTGKKIRSL